MIDFNNASFVKMSMTSNNLFDSEISPILATNEQVLYTYHGIRDGLVFTDKRLITINVQGVTGKKKDITSLPYSRIQAYSVETAGTFDLDCELILWFSGLGKVKLDLTRGTNIARLCNLISNAVL